ncbi:MAG: FAD-dependent oxidoreductase [Candidatus Woesearchaeota archaeon]|nr:FAD-dependent oxidoreductase [Candidatus Woesearchaeota archaeon]
MAPKKGAVYDVVIVGGGAAGMTAAMYTGRKMLKTVLLVGPRPGGETTLTNDIQNYPGYEKGTGTALMNIFEKQAKTWGAEVLSEKATRVTREKNGFSVLLEDGTKLTTKSVILTFGRKQRKLNIHGEKEWMGRGATTCTTCDGPLFPNKDVVIIGGGNAAVEAALEMATIAKKVFIVHRRGEYRADPVTVQKMRKEKKITELLNHAPVEIKGEKFVNALVVEDATTKKRKELSVQGVFIEIGYETDSSLVAGLVETNPAGEIVVDLHCKTKTPGLFAAGDMTITPYKQTVISAGMGATAALEAYKYLTTGKN